MNRIATDDQVVQFYLKVALGKHYSLIEHSETSPKTETDIRKAALRMAWNAAFRHVGNNIAKNMDVYAIEHFNKKYEEYIIIDILGDLKFLHIFGEYATEPSREKRISILNENHEYLKALFCNVKKEKCLTFGIFQKLFNMAIKWYFCFENSKSALGYDFELANFAFDKADCPIDNKILAQLDKLAVENKMDILTSAELPPKKNLADISWSTLNANTYKLIQKAISRIVGKDKSNLSFDFTNWE